MEHINKMIYPTKRGFTLIELMVVIAIIALLSLIVLSSLSTAKASGRDARKLQMVKQYATALELYRNANGAYPGPSIGLNDDADSGTSNFYCLGETSTCLYVAGGQTAPAATTLNNAIKPYIPGPPALTDPITLGSADFHGLGYGFCQNTSSSCAGNTKGNYILEWYMETTPNCASGILRTASPPYMCLYYPK